MASNLVKSALIDVLPDYRGEIPLSLISYVNRLYALSTSKLIMKPNEDIARYHICAVLAAEKLQKKLGLSKPVLDNIPIAPVATKRVLAEAKYTLLNEGAPPAMSAPTTPSKKRKSRPGSASATPTSSAHATPISTASTPARKKLFSGPSTPNSGSESPARRSRGRPPGALNRTTLEKIGQSPFQTASTIKAITPFLSPNKKVYLSTGEVIAFCNRFQLPSDVTEKVLATFIDFHNRIKHEWALICGLVALVFDIIHHSKLDSGLKQNFFDELHAAQKGNLLRQSLREWISLIHDFFEDAKWVKQIKFEYNYYADSNTGETCAMGNMLSVNRILQEESENQHWKSEILSNI